MDNSMVPEELSPEVQLDIDERIATAMQMARDDENAECAKIVESFIETVKLFKCATWDEVPTWLETIAGTIRKRRSA